MVRMLSPLTVAVLCSACSPGSGRGGRYRSTTGTVRRQALDLTGRDVNTKDR